jgi:tetratricopeptide (TPR) repeat protein
MAFWGRKPYDRVQVLAAADRARARGRLKKAIAGYRQVLGQSPRDLVVLGKVAPLLARTGQAEEAQRCFEAAARGQLEAGFMDRSLAVYVQAAEHFPERAFYWEEAARLHTLRGTRADAVLTLVEGGARLGRAVPDAGARLLRRALEIDAWHVEGRLVLSRLLLRLRQAAEARALLEELAPRLSGRPLRRVRGALFRLSPTPAAAWRWLRAALAGR